MLFKVWVTKGSVATFLGEPGCSSARPYAHELTSNVTLNGDSIHVAWNGMTFTAIHYDQLQAGAGAEGHHRRRGLHRPRRMGTGP